MLRLLLVSLVAVLWASADALPTEMGESASPVQLAPASVLNVAARAQAKVAQAIKKLKQATAKADNQGRKMQVKLAKAMKKDVGDQIKGIKKQVEQKEQEYVKKAAGAGKGDEKEMLKWQVITHTTHR